MTTNAVTNVLNSVPLVGMILDQIDHHAILKGTTTIDLSVFTKTILLPHRDSKRGYRRGIFVLFDAMGREVGKMHIIIR